MYYAAGNRYATETSIGFWNTWYVIGFATRATRDAYVKSADDLATRAIKSAELGRYGARRGRVGFYDADGRFFSHQERGQFFDTGDRIDPLTAAAIVTEMDYCCLDAVLAD